MLDVLAPEEVGGLQAVVKEQACARNTTEALNVVNPAAVGVLAPLQ